MIECEVMKGNNQCESWGKLCEMKCVRLEFAKAGGGNR